MVRPRASRPPRPRPQRPLIVAHRGASFDVAEHTLAAYTAAIESGADAVECDVRLTRDGHLVCVHDRSVNRTSDGRGLVSELDLAGLNALDFQSWHADWPDTADRLLRDEPYLAGVAPDRDPAGGVLTLERLLELVYDASGRVRVLIETKHPTRYSGLVEKELVKMLARFGWAGRPGPVSSVRRRPVEPTEGRATVMSFAPTALRRVRLLAPDVPTVLLLERLLPGRRDGSLPAGVGVAGPGLPLLWADPGFVARAHERGNLVYVWTVDDVAAVRFVIRLGVDAVITNRPATVLAELPARS